MAQKSVLKEIQVSESIESSEKNGESSEKNGESSKEYRLQPVWLNIFLLALLQIASFYGFYLVLTSAKLYTTIFASILVPLSLLGITAGTHRLWAHRSYEANVPLQIILLILGTMSWQGSVIKWARDHRLHHKYSETNADPYNISRGFFWAHVGWCMYRKHPELVEKGKGMNIDDLLSNPALRFQHKYYYYLAILMCYFVPTYLPMYFWNETFLNAFLVAAVLRLVVSLHIIFSVNSAAHLWGDRPYDKKSTAAENKLVAFLVGGEGLHNFHHVFPWDYKNAEFGIYRYNLACGFIDCFAYIGWAYNLKTVPTDMVRDRVIRTGDGTHNVWGWNDEDVTEKDRDTTILKHVRKVKE